MTFDTNALTYTRQRSPNLLTSLEGQTVDDETSMSIFLDPKIDKTEAEEL